MEDSCASDVFAQNAFYSSPFYFHLSLSPLSSKPQHPSIVYYFGLFDKNMQMCIKRKVNEVFSFLCSGSATSRQQDLGNQTHCLRTEIMHCLRMASSTAVLPTRTFHENGHVLHLLSGSH